MDNDTITAIATPQGFGGVGIVRVSGDEVQAICKKLFTTKLKSRYAHYLPVKIKNELIDNAIIIYYPAPHSYTGEDVLEIQAHGGPIILDQILKLVLSFDGVRLSNPGEFTSRAFLNDKMDLLQAESVMDMIHANSEQAARAAVSSLQGEFSKQINKLQDRLNNLRVYIEASMDFPDEEINFKTDKNLQKSFNQILDIFNSILKSTKQGELLKHGITIALAGAPNSGKSSLLNALLQRNSVIVSDIAGTTRDVISKTILLDSMPINIIDTAGIRKSYDEIEKIGISYALAEYKKADRILLIVDGNDSDKKQQNTIKKIIKKLPTNIPVDIIINKIDLSGDKACIKKDNNNNKNTFIYLSAKHKIGLEILKNHLKKSAGFREHEGAFMAKSRHINNITEAKNYLKLAKARLDENDYPELSADDLTTAQNALSKITGKIKPDDLLGDIFANFCIGK
ncbi:MAG: tRNA uridine-5-carboxymethylaminomethyl(34) synthesis GTPase MnmE [Gammaproteobacteria bacterium]|nr:MAG: tRNA uridine-5-carboxymethylaminomethyl(34) synthesis GTPase MnmE [Gammaproteobacteria bacterium]